MQDLEIDNALLRPQRRQPQHVRGWGADLAIENRPAGKKEGDSRGKTGVHWATPTQQTLDVEILHSIERPGITHVFGSSAPPRGLSGIIRRKAYTLGEGIKARWVLLLLADRVDMVEGLLEDLAHGHVPNLWKEMGLAAEFQYNRKAAIRNSVIAAGAVGLLTAFLLRRSATRT